MGISEELRVRVGDASFPKGSRYQRRSARQAAMSARSGPHEVVPPPPAKAASDGLCVHPANESFVPRGVVVAPRATKTLAKPSSSSCVAGATTLPAMRPYPAPAVRKRPFVVPPIAADGIIAHRASVAADEPPYKMINIGYSLVTQGMPPAAAAATAAIAAAAACAPGTEAHTAATVAATRAIIEAARKKDSLA